MGMVQGWGSRAAGFAVGLALAGALPAAAHAATLLYETGFESPTYQLGPVGDTLGLPASGQDGWRASPREPYSTAPSPWVSVSNARAASGSQSVQLRMDNSFFNGVNGNGPALARSVGLPGGLVLNSPTEAFSVSMKLYLDQAAASDVTWGLGLFSGGISGAGVTLDPHTGRLLWANTLMNVPAIFTPGFSLQNTWLDLKIERDAVDWTSLRLTVAGGGRSFSALVASPGGAMPTLAFFANMPNFPSAVSRGTAYVDDVRVGYNLAPVPEPATALMALAGAAWLAGVQRRRRRG